MSLKHSIRCAFKEGLGMDGQPGAKEIRFSRITVSGVGRSRSASVTLSNGTQIYGHVYLERDGRFAVVIMTILGCEIWHPWSWHRGYLRPQ